MGWQDAPVVEAKPKWASAPEVGAPAAAQATAETPTGRGGLSEFGVAAARGARGTAEAVMKGSAGLLPAGPVLKPLLEAGYNYIRGITHPDVSPTRTDSTGKAINTAGELVGSAVAAGGGIGASTLAGTAKKAAIEVAAPAVGGVVGEQVGGEPGKIIGSVAAPALTGAGIYAAKNAIAAKAAPTVATFKQAGTMPTVGQATENTFAQGIENLASKFPGGAGVMRRFIEGQQAAMGRQAKTGVSAEAAGRTIEQGVRGPGGFLERTKATWQQMDKDLAAKIPATTRFTPSNTVQALDDLTRTTPGAEKMTAGLVNPKIAEWRANLQADLKANNGVVPYEALRAIRTRVGSMLDDALVADVPKGELNKLYGALSKDMEAAATKAGAGQEFARQNNFYSARMKRVEEVLERVIGKGKQPEDIFKSFFPTDPDQAGKVRATLRSLDPAQRQVVSEAVVNRLGRATPGKQNDMGEIWSSETFLTNWNKLSDGAKQQLFPNHSMRQNVEAISKASANIREGSKLYANPSGTAGSFAAYAIYTAPLTALGTLIGGAGGGAAVLGTAAASAGAANIGAKMLTSPKVVEWLARPVNPAKSGEAAAHLARLVTIYNQSNDEALKSEIAQFVAAAGANK